MSKVVIVGAGISGLAIAYRLQQAVPSCDITVLEKAHRPGGVVWTERHEDFQVEFGPNGFLDNKSSTINLCRDLGLSDQLVAASDVAGRNRYLLRNGQLQPLPIGLRSFFTSKLFSWQGKLNLLAEVFRPQVTDSGDESIDHFVCRRAGKEAAEILADALVTGIYAGDPKLLSLPATFPRLAQWEKEHGSLTKGLFRTSLRRRKNSMLLKRPAAPRTRMWSLRQGLRVLIESLLAQLQKPPLMGVTVRRIAGVRDSSRPTSGWMIVGNGKDQWPADAVILACPAYQQAALLGDFDGELAERVGQIAYNRLAVVALGFHRADVPGRLDGFGYIAGQRNRRDVLGVQWCSSIFPGRAPADTVLLRAMCGGWSRPEIAGWEDARLLEAVRAELRLTMSIAATPIFHRIIRWDRAIPQYHLGHLERVAWIEKRSASHPGLFLAGNAYHGVALNDCTEQAEIVAARVARFLMDSA